MRRSALFALTGILWLMSWVVGPSFEMAPSMERWLSVLLFSASLLSLAVSLLVLSRVAGGRDVIRLATIAGAVAGLMSIANVFEDGFQIDWVFFVFVAGLLILDVTLLALAIVIARTTSGPYRLLAVAPAGTVVGILIGPTGVFIILIVWFIAAVAVLGMLPARTGEPAAPTTT